MRSFDESAKSKKSIGSMIESNNKTSAAVSIAATSPHKSSSASSSHHKSSSSSSSSRSKTSSSSSSSHHHHSSSNKKSSIGVQCRRDKNVEKYVGFKAAATPARTKYAGFSMANPCPALGNSKYKYGHLMRVETYPNGFGKVLHMWQDELNGLDEKELEIVAKEFLVEAFREEDPDTESAVYCCAVVHDAARGLPDFLEYLADNHGSLTIKHGIIGHPRDMETTSMKNYQERVAESYASGTYRFGFLDNISLVGTVAEESGGFFPDILDMLDENPFLRMVSYFLSSQFTNFVVSFMMFYTSVNPMTNL